MPDVKGCASQHHMQVRWLRSVSHAGHGLMLLTAVGVLTMHLKRCPCTCAGIAHAAAAPHDSAI